MTSMVYTMAPGAPVRGGVLKFAAVESVPVEEISAERMEKVMRLKAAIEEGRYFVSSADVAERIMAAMLGNGSLKVQ